MCGGTSLWWAIGWRTSQDSQLLNFILLFPLAIIFIWFSFHEGGRITEWLQPFYVSGYCSFCPAQLASYPQAFIAWCVIWFSGFGMLVVSGYTVVQSC